MSEALVESTGERMYEAEVRAPAELRRRDNDLVMRPVASDTLQWGRNRHAADQVLINVAASALVDWPLADSPTQTRPRIFHERG